MRLQGSQGKLSEDEKLSRRRKSVWNSIGVSSHQQLLLPRQRENTFIGKPDDGTVGPLTPIHSNNRLLDDVVSRIILT